MVNGDVRFHQTYTIKYMRRSTGFGKSHGESMFVIMYCNEPYIMRQESAVKTSL